MCDFLLPTDSYQKDPESPPEKADILADLMQEGPVHRTRPTAYALLLEICTTRFGDDSDPLHSLHRNDTHTQMGTSFKPGTTVACGLALTPPQPPV